MNNIFIGIGYVVSPITGISKRMGKALISSQLAGPTLLQRSQGGGQDVRLLLLQIIEKALQDYLIRSVSCRTISQNCCWNMLNRSQIVNQLL